MSKPERLDFEDEDARRERLSKLFADFSDSTSKSADTPSIDLPKTESRPFAVPESDVLARVRAFLPEFKSSTTALVQQASQDPSSVNVESVKKGESAIAMDLGLGVYDAPGAKGREGELEGMGMGPVVDSNSGGLGDDGTSSEDDEDDDEDEADEEDEDAAKGKQMGSDEESTSSESESESEIDSGGGTARHELTT